MRETQIRNSKLEIRNRDAKPKAQDPKSRTRNPGSGFGFRGSSLEFPFRVAVLSLVLLLGAGLGRIRAQGSDNAQPETQVAPDFTLTDVNGDEITLSDLLQNGPVYMESWDLPCVNCIAELDALMPVYDSLQDQGLQIIALSVDKPADEARVRSFAASKKWPYIVLLDQQEAVMKQYGIIIKPTAYLINQNSEIVFTHIGYKKGDEDRIKEEFLKVLPGPATDSSGPAPKGEN